MTTSDRAEFFRPSRGLLLAVTLALGCGGSGPSGGNPPPGNHAPDVTATVAAGAVMIGAATQASPQGSFSSQGVPSPTWTAPVVAQLTKFTLAVTVSDGKGGTKTASATVYV